jgi:hypothetical protein
MRYCKKCLTTSLRPNALFNAESVCIPCEYEQNIIYALAIPPTYKANISFFIA